MVELTPNWELSIVQPPQVFPFKGNDDDPDFKHFLTSTYNLKSVLDECKTMTAKERLEIFCNLVVRLGDEARSELSKTMGNFLRMFQIQPTSIHARISDEEREHLFMKIHVHVLAHHYTLKSLNIIADFHPDHNKLAERFAIDCPYRCQSALWWERNQDSIPQLVEDWRSSLTEAQVSHYESIRQSLEGGREFSYMLRGEAQTGKTRLLNLIHAELMMEDPTRYIISLGCSPQSTNLLLGGQNFVRRFELDGENNLMPPDSTSDFAKSLRNVYLIIIDGVQNLSSRHFDFLNDLLKAVTGRQVYMGGKCVVMAGDFNQMMAPPISFYDPPLLESRTFVANTAYLTSKFTPLTYPPPTEFFTDSNEIFQQFLQNDVKSAHGRLRLSPVIKYFTNGPGCAVSDLINFVYSQLVHCLDKADYFTERTILCRSEMHAELINKAILNRIPEYFGVINCFATDSRGDCELPNSLVGPPHHLKFFKGMPLKLTRNYDPAQGLNEGVIVYFDDMPNPDVITVLHRLTPDTFYPVHLPLVLTRMVNKTKFPVKFFSRRQFPVRPAFARSIAQAEGEHFDVVGIMWSREAREQNHGEWYQAMTRLGTSNVENLAVCLPYVLDPTCVFINNTVCAFVDTED